MRYLSLLLAPCFLCLSGVVRFLLPALLVALSGRVAGRGLSCRRAVLCGLSLVARSLVSVGWLLVLRSSSRFIVSDGGSLTLRGSSRLSGAGGGAGRLLLSACLGEAGGERVWIMWSALFSVDYLGTVGYIISRALMLLSPFFVSWHVLVVRAVLWFSAPPIALVQCPNKSVPPGRGRERFFLLIFISSYHLSAACLRGCFCYPATIISISPRSSPRFHRHDRRGGPWLRYGWRGRRCRACLVRRWMATGGAELWRWRALLDFARAISCVRCHPYHEMIRRLGFDVGPSLIFRPTPSCPLSSACLL